MRRLTGRLAVSIVASMLTLTAVPPAAPAADKTLPFGLNTPLSGPAAPNGRTMLRAFELAAEDVNVDGIKVGGDVYRVKLFAYDSKYDTREAVNITNNLIFNDHVRYMATVGGTIAAAINPMTNENKVLQLLTAYGGKQVTNPDTPYTFRAILEPTQAYLVLLPWVVKRYGIKTMAITSTDDETGLVQAQDSEREALKLGVTITDKVFGKRGTADFSPMLTRIIAKKPDAIDFGAWAGSEGPVIYKQARELGYTGQAIMSYGQSIPTFIKFAGDLSAGALFFQIFGGDPTPAATRVRERYEAKYREAFEPLVWRYVDILPALRLAMQTVNSVDSAVVKDAIRDVKLTGVLGPMRVGGASYYGVNAQMLFPTAVSTWDAKAKKLVELYRGEVPPGY